MKVLKVLPDHYGANLNAGNLCMYAGLLNLSLAYHVKALNSPTLSTYYKIGLLNNMGQTLKMQFRIEKSIELFLKALEISPSDRTSFFNLYKARRTACDWRNVDFEISQLVKLVSAEIQSGQSTTMLPYDATLLPVPRHWILQATQLHTKSWERLAPKRKSFLSLMERGCTLGMWGMISITIQWAISHAASSRGTPAQRCT